MAGVMFKLGARGVARMMALGVVVVKLDELGDVESRVGLIR